MASEEIRAIEAILMVADRPVEPGLLAQLLEVSPQRVEELCRQLSDSYTDSDRGFVIARVAGGYRFQSHPDLAPYVERFVLEGQSARLSAAALETLAIVAYKQPVSRAQIGAIRGVNADGVLRTLQQRGFVDEIGRDPGPGQAVLYGTTQLLLERLGMDGIGDLPPLGDFVPGPEIMEALEHSLRAEPAGGASSTEPAGGASSTEPAGGASSTEPAGGASSTEPAGGASSTEPAGGAGSTEPVQTSPAEPAAEPSGGDNGG